MGKWKNSRKFLVKFLSLILLPLSQPIKNNKLLGINFSFNINLIKELMIKMLDVFKNYVKNRSSNFLKYSTDLLTSANNFSTLSTCFFFITSEFSSFATS